MKRFRNILCVVSDERTKTLALERAVTLAGQNQAKLTVINVMPTVSIGMGMPENGPISAELQQKAQKVRTDTLHSMVEPFSNDLEIQSHIRVGVQFLEIIREVLAHAHDLVIKEPDTEEWLDHLLGSEDMHLVRKCPCPVWLIKPSPRDSFRRVLAAVDVVSIYPESEKETRLELNRKIIEMASSLALADGAELHIVHAWQAMSEHTFRELFMQKTGFSVDAYVAGVEQERNENLDQLMQSLNLHKSESLSDSLNPHVHLVRGRARKEVPEMAQKLNADLLVMGTVGRTGVPGLFTGNTAESILSQIGCSVLAIKPNGFETPVTLP